MSEKQTDVYRSYSLSQDEQVVPLSYFLAVLRRRALPVLAVIAVGTIGAYAISRSLPALYESTVTLDLERQSSLAPFGQDAFLTTQINIIRSDAVLRPVVEKYKLDGYDPAANQQGGAAGQEIPVLTNLRVTHPPNSFLILIAYRSTSPEQAADIVNSIADSYLRDRLSVGALSSQVAEKELAAVKERMDRSTARLEQSASKAVPQGKSSALQGQLVQVDNELAGVAAERERKQSAEKVFRDGSLEAVQASPLADPFRGLLVKLAADQAQFDKMSADFTPKHPNYKKAETQLKETQGLVDQSRKSIAANLGDEVKKLVAREATLSTRKSELTAELQKAGVPTVDTDSLRREADADRALYQDMLRRVKDPAVTAKTPENSIRLLDRGRIPRYAVSPDVRTNVLLGLVLSTLLAVGGAVILELADDTVRDPSRAARAFRLDILGTLPFSNALRKGGALREVLAGRSGDKQSTRFLNAVETLHNSMLPVAPTSQERVRSLLVVSSTPGDGATTVGAALAVVHARQRRRTLLIDANLRHPGIHDALGVEQGNGFSEVLSAQASWRDALRHSKDWPDLDILTAGGSGARALDLLALKLPPLLAGAAGEYDLVVIECAPLDPFPESLQIAPLVDAVAVVCAEGRSKNARIQAGLVSLARVKAKVSGLVLNQARTVSFSLNGNYGG